MFNIVATFSHYPDIRTTIDGQVCFHRRSFASPVKPRRSTTESVGPLMGTAWGVKLLLTTILSYQVDCGSFCALLRTQHCMLFASLWTVLPAFGFPPTPNTYPTRPPPINFICDITGVVKSHHTALLARRLN